MSRALGWSSGQLWLDERAGLLYFADTANLVVRTSPLSGSGPTVTVGGGPGFGLRNGSSQSARSWELGGFVHRPGLMFVSDNVTPCVSVVVASAEGPR